MGSGQDERAKDTRAEQINQAEQPAHGGPTDAGGPERRPSTVSSEQPTRRTRVGSAWTAVAAAVIVLVLLLIFILQNLQAVTVTYFGATGRLPLGVAILLAAAGGALLVVALGAARILQLRASVRRQRRQHKKAQKTQSPP